MKINENILTSSRLGTTSLTMLQIVSKSEDSVSILKVEIEYNELQYVPKVYRKINWSEGGKVSWFSYKGWSILTKQLQMILWMLYFFSLFFFFWNFFTLNNFVLYINYYSRYDQPNTKHYWNCFSRIFQTLFFK